jgi:gliding motility-associated-like protein
MAITFKINRLSFLSKLFVAGIVTLGATQLVAQTVETFNFTGGSQSWTVPDCVTSITVTVAGAEGGGSAGGNGAVVTSTITVTPGQVINMNVGGQGGAGTTGYGGGGTGHLSSDGNFGYASYGGGGASTVTIGGAPYIIAAGGGGTGGGSNNVAGGNGGCATGVTGASTFGLGGGAGSQVAGGAGGTPWAATPPGGQAGSLGQGGNGGPWQTASGGGGGGGYYGGGGGGNDGCCTGANGGGGGGGGSSLVPAGAGCNAGSNTGNGSISISFIGGLNPTADNPGPFCTGETIELFGAGGVNFSWTGPNGFTSTDQNPTIPNATETMAGTYTVMVTDPACPDTVFASPDVVINLTPTVDPMPDITVCNGEVVNPGNFSGNSPTATYAWTNTSNGIGLAWSGNGNIIAFYGTAVANDQTGTISVTPTNNGCVGDPESFVITVLRDPSLTVSNDTTICQNGTAYLVGTGIGGGGGPYTYHWDHTPSPLANQNENPTVSTTYTVYVESVNGCVSAPQDIEVTLRDPLTGTISPWDTVCPTYDTDIFATVTGGLGEPYTFVWSNGATYTGVNNHMINVTPPATQNYTVTITDECESTPLVMTTNVRVSPLPVPEYTVLNPIQCEPAIFDIVNSTDSSMSQYVYWLVNNDEQYINQDTITTVEFWGGNYDIQMIVTSYEGCVDSLTFENALNVKYQPHADFKYSPNPVTMFNTNVLFQNHSTNADYYEWFFEGGYPGTSAQTNVNVQYPEGVVGEYEVMLVAHSDLGCRDTALQTLIVFPEVIIYAPNAFTPDGDAFNQTWRVYMEGIDVYEFELLIYDRWGEVIWESHDINVGWDGMYNGQPVPTGTYVWTIRTKDSLNDAKYNYEGHVSILR